MIRFLFNAVLIVTIQGNILLEEPEIICEEFANKLTSVKCLKKPTNKELYGKNTFFINTHSSMNVLKITKFTSNTQLILNILDNNDHNEYFNWNKRFNNKKYQIENGYLLETKNICFYQSLEILIKNGNDNFSFSKKNIELIMIQLIKIAKFFLENNIIYTDFIPSRICIDDDFKIKIINLENIQKKDELGSIENIPPLFLPPEYHMAAFRNEQIPFTEKLMTYQLAILYFIIYKKRVPFEISTINKDIWNKKIFFYSNDSNKFIYFIMKTLTPETNRMDLEHLYNFFFYKSDQAVAIFKQNHIKFYTMGENMLLPYKQEDKKIDIFSLILIVLFLIVFSMLLIFLFCKDLFYMLLPFTHKKETKDDISVDSGEYQSKPVDTKKEEPIKTPNKDDIELSSDKI